ncbi:MAG: transglycosylase SLT domain-containing protein [Bacteroidaceae bacterium]|nr:transglycosylase SLT domain-containing protein [Bacteroidaceae bacterium]
MNKYLYFLCLTLIIFTSCVNNKPKEVTKNVTSFDFFDLDEIQRSGQIIVLSTYSPETYYENHGLQGGLQFQIVQEFAKNIGARIRIEVANDENELIQRLISGEADLIAYNLPLKDSLKKELIWCGDSLETRKASWVVRHNSPNLARAVQNWFQTHVQAIHEIYNKENQLKTIKTSARIQRRAIVKNPSKGIISDYDAIYKKYSRQLGWDWKLLAAQSYQESAFDPKATSWAGARGLMQLMTTTAQQVGVALENIYNPEENIRGGVKYLHYLHNHFKDITNPTEKINFVLAAYNCGTAHVRDAQALAQKYGKNPNVWKDNVDQYILLLQEAEYNRDPIVKNGYCRGSETYNYVNSIMSIYSQYRKIK